MNYLVFDIAILVILLLFALWGAHRGLILSLCSLVAVLVAFVGALLIANWGAPLLAPHLAPVLEGPVSSAVEAALPEDLAQSGQTLEELLDQLSQTELPFHLNDMLEELSDELAASLSSENLVEELSASLAGRLAESVAWLGLFFIAFVLVLILWTLFSRTLDLVANLPGLHFLNRTGGFVLGAFKGCVFLFVAAFLVRWLWSGLIPAQAVEQSKLLHFFLTTNPMDLFASL